MTYSVARVRAYFRESTDKSHEYFEKNGKLDPRTGLYPPIPMPPFRSLSWYLMVTFVALTAPLTLYAFYMFTLAIDSVVNPPCGNSCGAAGDVLVEATVGALWNFLGTGVFVVLNVLVGLGEAFLELPVRIATYICSCA